MPTLIFLAIAYQIQNIKWRSFFIVLTAASFIFNLYDGMWPQEVYSLVIVMLLFMLTPHFSRWWQKRNERNNPDSFLNFAKDAWLLTKYNKYDLLFWVFFLILSITAVCFYTGLTNQILLGNLLAVFLLIYGFKNLFFVILPPEWFLHDANTEYTFFSVFIAWWLSHLIAQKMGVQFTLPMIMAAVTCLGGFYLVKKNNRYLMPGCALVFADLIWQLLRLIQESDTYSSSLITTVLILVITLLIGLIWLIKKPGIMPIVYLTLFQLFRFSTFSYEATENAVANNLSVSEASDYTLYLVCWMYIVPLLFWIVGSRQIERRENTGTPKHVMRENRSLENLKRRAGDT
ncbi:MAG TPA: hypothetical protein VLJ15_02865 [Gammaproteobacteria bacterium]|nr:hypothetical protein [Gammaproteobacteria bacterium]